MKLRDALKIIHEREAAKTSTPFVGFLACGFEPLHLETALWACLKRRFSQFAVSIEHGIFGGLLGNLDRLSLPLPPGLAHTNTAHSWF